MQVAFDALELSDAWLDSGPSARWRLNLPLSDISKVAERELELDAAGVVAIPQQAPHEVRNSGSGPARRGLFRDGVPVSTFDEPVMPGGTQLRGTTC